MLIILFFRHHSLLEDDADDSFFIKKSLKYEASLSPFKNENDRLESKEMRHNKKFLWCSWSFFLAACSCSNRLPLFVHVPLRHECGVCAGPKVSSHVSPFWLGSPFYVWRTRKEQARSCIEEQKREKIRTHQQPEVGALNQFFSAPIKSIPSRIDLSSLWVTHGCLGPFLVYPWFRCLKKSHWLKGKWKR